MKVRFKREYSGYGELRVAYELEKDEPEYDFDTVSDEPCLCWCMKGGGRIPFDLMEITEDENDIPFVDIMIEVNKIQNEKSSS